MVHWILALLTLLTYNCINSKHKEVIVHKIEDKIVFFR